MAFRSRSGSGRRPGRPRLSARVRAGLLVGVALLCGADRPCVGQGVPLGSGDRLPSELRPGRVLLQEKRFGEAKIFFASYLKAHAGTQPGTQSGTETAANAEANPAEVQAELGLGDAELGLREFEAAELTYRSAVAANPELSQANNNLVVVEAALGRWEEFDGERRLLRLARERGAPGISAEESDVIDSFTEAGEHWVVRAYFEPVGRSQARYNFERFSRSGRVEAYLSLEDAAAAQAALTPGDVRVGPAAAGTGSGAEAGRAAEKAFALNWYTGAAHGTVRRYPDGEPSYERVRADVLRWLRVDAVRTHAISSGAHK